MFRSDGRHDILTLAGIVLLVGVTVAFATGCSSNTPANSRTTATTASASQTGSPGGTPPSAPGGSASGTGSPMTPPTGGSSTTATAATSSSTDSTTTTTPAADGTYSDGIYLVGTDIASGLYHGTVKGDEGQWEIASDANGNKFVAGGDPTGPFYLKVTSGQYLTLSRVTIEKASTTAADPLATSNLTDGTYRAGYDIAVGWYDGTVNGGLGYWEVSTDANGQTLVANDYPQGPFTLKVKSGQYLTLRGVTVSQ